MPEQSKVRLGVIGIGNIAPLNLRGYLADNRCEVVALCDPVVERASQMATLWSVPGVFNSLDQMLAEAELDAVEILTPTHLHHDHVIAALEAGLHVSCQKPIANTVKEARAMAAAADASGRIFRISECYRHYPPLEKAKELIVAGAIGEITNVRSRTIVGTTDSPFQAGLMADGYVWRLNNLSPGGHMFDDMVHKFAMALWLGGQDIVGVQAALRRRDMFFEPANVIFEYEDPKLLGALEMTYAPKMFLRSSYYGADEFFEIQGDKGFIWVTRCTGELLDFDPVMIYQGEGEAGHLVGHKVESDWGAGFDRSANNFIDAILGEAEAAMTASDAIKVLQLCFAIYAAGNTQQRIDPREIEEVVIPHGWGEW